MGGFSSSSCPARGGRYIKANSKLAKWLAIQEADKFYGAAKRNESIDAASTSRPSHLALASTLDEYGDIRHQNPVNRVPRGGESPQNNDPYSRVEGHDRSSSQLDVLRDLPSLDANAIMSENGSNSMLSHSLETELLQWPFIDETWSTGIESGWLN